MQQNGNNMDNKLKQVETQSLPDLSRQDKHWQEMKKMLQPQLTPTPPKPPRSILRFIVAASIIAVVAFLGYKLNHKQKKNQSREETIAVKSVKENIKSIINLKDSIPAKDMLSETKGTLYQNIAKPIKMITTAAAFPRISSKKVDEYKKETGIVLEPIDIKPAEPAEPEAPKATLASFFSQLEKPAQEFVIDNTRDTVINGKDGTALLIPANTFNTNGKVTIVLKEYYSYQDIITNKLCTTSDGKQLVTGGMIHISAMADGKEIDMQPSKNIRWFVPDTSSTNMKGMQLFTGIENRNWQLTYSSTLMNMQGDTLKHEERYDGLNWVPQRRNFQNDFFVTMVKVLDLRDLPYKVRYTKKGTIAKFNVGYNPKVDKDSLKKILADKYYYDKVVIKEQRLKGADEVGDSVWVEKSTAKRFKLPYKDSIVNNNYYYWSRTGFKFRTGQSTTYRTYDLNPKKRNRPLMDTLKNENPLQDNFNATLNNRFSVDISSMGWINCDRFYNDTRPKMPLYVDLKDNAEKYYTVLVFDKLKSMMTGSVAGNKVMFSNLPEGETAKVISVGIKDGKPISAMETVQVAKNAITSLKFEETTPAEFKQQAASMDK
jgi:hypothetical protein